MRAEAPSEEKTLFERASVQETRALLADAARTSAATLIWNPSYETPLSTTFSKVSEKDQIIRVALPKEPLPKAFLVTSEDSANQSFVFSVKVPKANFFFKADYIGDTD